MPNYWLVKSEPEAYSIDNLNRDGKTYWDGVRNYQARNFLRDQMKPGDRAFFYHSNAEPSGIAGICEIASRGYPDPSALDPKDQHYDPKSTKAKPIWYVVDIQFIQKFRRILPLEEIKKIPGLEKMVLLKRGRLSVQPVSAKEWEMILKRIQEAKHA